MLMEYRSDLFGSDYIERYRDRALTVVGQQILVQLVTLILQHFAKIHGNLASDLLDIRVQFAKIVGQTDQLIQGANLAGGERGNQLDKVINYKRHL